MALRRPADFIEAESCICEHGAGRDVCPVELRRAQRPRSALATAAVLRTDSFSFAYALLCLMR